MNELNEILSEDDSLNWNSEIDGKLTFLGVITHYYKDVIKGWNVDSTRKTYFRDFQRYVFPYLNDKPLEAYTKDVFMEILDRLPERKRERGHVFNEKTARHFWFIINRVLQVASNNNICPNVLWGGEKILEDINEEKDNEKEFVRLRKSLLPQEEIRVTELILSDPMQCGQRMGLALMFCLGLRNGEACGADWEDIHAMECDPEIDCLLVYKSTEPGSNNQKIGGKTKNMGRMIPIPQRLKALLQLRKKCLKEKLEKGEIPGFGVHDLDMLPIACDGSNFAKRCSAKLLTKEGTTVLQKTGMDEDILSYINRDLRLGIEGITEKDPTAYLFRRNLGTHLFLLGLSESEIQYIFGHKIKSDSELRSNFRNEEKFYPIAQKMAQRPIVNDVLDKTHAITMDGKNIYKKGIISQELIIPVKEKGRSKMRITQQEPYSKLRVELVPKNVMIQGSQTQHQNLANYEKTLSIVGTYHKRYREIQRHMEKREKEGKSADDLENLEEN